MDSLQIGTAIAHRGERAFGAIKVAELNDGSPVEIPVGILHGAKPGPVVWMQNGVHGMEYTGMGGIQRVLNGCDPREMAGSVVGIPMVNIMAYRYGTRGAPQDGLDMNRTYPGKPLDAAMHVFAHTELVLDQIFSEIKRVADCVLDCHAGGWHAYMSPYAQYATGMGGDDTYEQKCHELAVATGMTLIWRTESAFMEEKAPGSLKVWAAKLGIPGLTLEVGGEGKMVDPEVGRFHQALMNVLRHLGIVAGKPEIPGEQYEVIKGHWLRPTTGGCLVVKARPLERVKKGQVIHIITDLLGRERERLLAPVDGVVVGIRTHGKVNSGDYCGNIGIIGKRGV